MRKAFAGSLPSVCGFCAFGSGGWCPDSPCENNGKALRMTETTPRVVVGKALFARHREKTRAAKQCIVEAQTAMSMKVHRSHVLKGGGGAAKKWQDSHLHP